MDSFAGHPTSITEARADRERDGSLWTPRDALISALRDLDEGKFEPVSLAIVGLVPKPEDGPKAKDLRYYQSSPDDVYLLGLLTMATHDLARP